MDTGRELTRVEPGAEFPIEAVQTVHDACPDGGSCHHGCAGPDLPCFRVLNCVPLSAYGEDWEDEDKRVAAALARAALDAAVAEAVASQPPEALSVVLDPVRVNITLTVLVRGCCDPEEVAQEVMDLVACDPNGWVDAITEVEGVDHVVVAE